MYIFEFSSLRKSKPLKEDRRFGKFNIWRERKEEGGRIFCLILVNLSRSHIKIRKERINDWILYPLVNFVLRQVPLNILYTDSTAAK